MTKSSIMARNLTKHSQFIRRSSALSLIIRSIYIDAEPSLIEVGPRGL